MRTLLAALSLVALAAPADARRIVVLPASGSAAKTSGPFVQRVGEAAQALTDRPADVFSGQRLVALFDDADADLPSNPAPDVIASWFKFMTIDTVVTTSVDLDAAADELSATVSVVDAASGRVLGSLPVHGANGRRLAEAFAAEAPAFFEGIERPARPEYSQGGGREEVLEGGGKRSNPRQADRAPVRDENLPECRAASAAPVAKPAQHHGKIAIFPMTGFKDGKSDGVRVKRLEEAVTAFLTEALTPLGYAVLPPDATANQMINNRDDELTDAEAKGEFGTIAKLINVEGFASAQVTYDQDDDTYSTALVLRDTDTGKAYAQWPPTSGANAKVLADAVKAVSPKFLEQARESLAPELAEQRIAKKKLDDACTKASADAAKKRADEQRYALPKENPIYDWGGRLVVRAGLGGGTGILGVGFEYHSDSLSLDLGYGSYFTIGGTWYPLRDERSGGGPYLSAHLARATMADGERSDGGIGATIGFDYRPVKWISVKGGAGPAFSSAAFKDPKKLRILLVDLSAGLVF